MSMFVTYEDESGNGSPTFVVGALTAKAQEGWMPFADDWQRLLDTPPRVPHLKFNNEHQLPIAELHKKIEMAVQIINRHVERANVILIDAPGYESYFANLVNPTFDKPFNLGYMSIMQHCALLIPDKTGKVAFIFDDMDDTSYLDLLATYRGFLEALEDGDLKSRFAGEPVRQNDKLILPLQGADIWTGLVRAAALKNKWAYDTLKKLTIPATGHEWSTGKIAKLLGSSVKKVPALASGSGYESRKKRAARLKPLRKELREKGRGNGKKK